MVSCSYQLTIEEILKNSREINGLFSESNAVHSNASHSLCVIESKESVPRCRNAGDFRSGYGVAVLDVDVK